MKKSLSTVPTLTMAALLSFGAASFAMAAHPLAPDNDDQGQMDSDQPVTDTWITTKVKSELATTDGVDSMDISVKTVDGVVYLTGTQANDVAVKKATAAAESIKGVQRVDASGLKSKS